MREDLRMQKTSKQNKQYKRLRNEMQRRCRIAQNNWIDGKWIELEALFRNGKVDAAYKKIKENFGKRRVNANMLVRNKNGKALTESRDKVNKWIEYIEGLYMGDVLVDLIEN